eukprot:2135473-Amphidinium_carterae.2
MEASTQEQMMAPHVALPMMSSSARVLHSHCAGFECQPSLYGRLFRCLHRTCRKPPILNDVAWLQQDGLR